VGDNDVADRMRKVWLEGAEIAGRVVVGPGVPTSIG
jgi:hypothetical protein